jgi:hypothetical protein
VRFNDGIDDDEAAAVAAAAAAADDDALGADVKVDDDGDDADAINFRTNNKRFAAPRVKM